MKYFLIFDVNAALMDANKEIVADSPINAVKKYLSEKGSNLIPKRSGSNYVQISAREFHYKEDGNKYYSHKPVQWYELKTVV